MAKNKTRKREMHRGGAQASQPAFTPTWLQNRNTLRQEMERRRRAVYNPSNLNNTQAKLDFIILKLDFDSLMHNLLLVK
jgi:hypothetical protein